MGTYTNLGTTPEELESGRLAARLREVSGCPAPLGEAAGRPTPGADGARPRETPGWVGCGLSLLTSLPSCRCLS